MLPISYPVFLTSAWFDANSFILLYGLMDHKMCRTSIYLSSCCCLNCTAWRLALHHPPLLFIMPPFILARLIKSSADFFLSFMFSVLEFWLARFCVYTVIGILGNIHPLADGSGQAKSWIPATQLSTQWNHSLSRSSLPAGHLAHRLACIVEGFNKEQNEVFRKCPCIFLN